MNTEDDLRATLGALEFQAPDPVSTLAGLERLRTRRTTRRRVAGTVAVAAVTVALVGASLAAPAIFRDDPAPSQTQNPPANRAPVKPLEFRFAVDDIPGFKTFYQGAGLVPGHFGKVFETAGDYPVDTNQQPYDVYVFAAGEYKPEAARTGEPIEVRGKPGFYKGTLPCHCSGESPIAGLAWEYAPDTWALVQYTKPAGSSADKVKANLIRIANAVRFDKTTPVRVPFKIGWLPEGLKLTSGDQFTWDPDRGGAHLGWTATTPGAPGLSIGMFYLGERSELPVGEPQVQDSLMGGTAVLINLGPFQVQLDSWVPGEERLAGAPSVGLPVEDLVKIAKSMSAAGTPLDLSTWIEAAQAVPAG